MNSLKRGVTLNFALRASNSSLDGDILPKELIVNGAKLSNVSEMRCLGFDQRFTRQPV